LDKEREQETKTLLADASAFASNHGGVPVIYAGDFNSHGGTHVALDGPAVVMRAHHIADTKDVAQHRTNTRYDSANEYYRTPPAWGENLDHIWAVPGVGVRDWEQLLHLSGGKFVGTIPSDHNPLVADLRLAR
jgi:endonuclease/exonuclease/phosphatase family metal-dependent hydrolase